MPEEEILLKRALERERKARFQAEKLLEDKSRELFEAQQKLKSRLEFLEEVLRSTEDLVFVFSKEKGLVLANKEALSVLGRSQEEVEGLKYRDLLEEVGSVNVSTDSELHQGYLVGSKKTLIEWTSSPLLSLDGVRGEETVITAHNIDERRRIEGEVQILSKAVTQSADAIFITDPNGEIEYVNPSFELLTGWKKEEVEGKTPSFLKHPDHGVFFFQDMWETILSGKTFKGTLTNRRKDGTAYYAEKIISPIQNSQGEITHFVSSERDITKRVELEKQVVQSEKLATVGQMAAGLAHEINNPIGYISGNLECLKVWIEEFEETIPSGDDFPNLLEALKKERRDEAKEMIGDSLLGVKKIVEIVRALRSFTSPEKQEWQEVVLKDELEQVLGALEILPNQITLSGDDVNHRIQGISGQMGLVFQYLLENALIHGGADVHILIKFERKDEGIQVTISDNGPGVPREIQSRIFDPFFTTREVGQGTGLGLSMAQAIVKSHHGNFYLQDSQDQGATFVMDFKTMVPENMNQPYNIPIP